MSVQNSRLPVRFGPASSRRADEAVLSDKTPLPAPPSFAVPIVPVGHALGCSCCILRPAATLALADVFRRWVLGTAFRAVLADLSAGNEAALRAALEGDIVVAARFRLQPEARPAKEERR